MENFTAKKSSDWKMLMKTYLVMLTINKLTRQLQYIYMYKITLYIQTDWPFQLKFEIYIFGVVILQIKQKSKFWQIGSCTFKWLTHICREDICI